MTGSRENVPLWIQLVSGGICILSILGSLAIILTYVLVKGIRSKARELLVHISLMDIMYSTANLVGLALPYSKYLDNNHQNNQSSESVTSLHDTYELVCKAQAFIAVYGTIGSVLWTLGLAVYLYYMIVSRSSHVIRRLGRVLYVVCYTLPLYVTLWLLLDNWLGYPHSVLAGAGWCSFRDDVDTVVIFMTYDIWIWLGILILVPLYFIIHIHIREQVKEQQIYLTLIDHPIPVIKSEQKLLLVPVVFIFLRIWDIIGDVVFVYYNQPESGHFVWLQILMSIGDCGQGFFNFVIFFMFHPRLRSLLWNNFRVYCCQCCRCCYKTASDFQPTASDSGEHYTSLSESLKEPPYHGLFLRHTPQNKH